jgi:DNA-binding NtrC family response regulator
MLTKILIVDDEKLILEEASESLISEGYECFIASGVDAAVEIVKDTPEIQLILTDLRMPQKTGADLIKIIETKYGKRIKFVIMSGHACRKIDDNGIDLASYPFLRKPLDVDNLIETIDSVL